MPGGVGGYLEDAFLDFLVGDGAVGVEEEFFSDGQRQGFFGVGEEGLNRHIKRPRRLLQAVGVHLVRPALIVLYLLNTHPDHFRQTLLRPTRLKTQFP